MRRVTCVSRGISEHGIDGCHERLDLHQPGKGGAVANVAFQKKSGALRDLEGVKFLRRRLRALPDVLRLRPRQQLCWIESRRLGCNACGNFPITDFLSFSQPGMSESQPSAMMSAMKTATEAASINRKR